MKRSLVWILGLLTSVFFISCQKEISYELGSAAKGSLQSSSGECLPKNVAGTYVAGKALADTNYIEVTINITQAGPYSISTDTVNGYYFSGSGSFNQSGTTTVRLTGKGTPGVEGVDNFVLAFDSSSCSVAVTVLPAGSSPGGGNTSGSTDHFILTPNSFWTYDDPFNPGDTVKRSIIGTANSPTNTYTVMREQFSAGADSLYYRKAGNDYFEYTFTDAFTTVTFDSAALDDILFLKEGLNTGDTWASPEYSGTENGTPVKLTYTFTCNDANATLNKNGLTFNNVYKVTMVSKVSLNGAPYQDDVTWVSYYAQSIGLVYQTISVRNNNFESTIRHWQVF
jgi:hypothetical protein